MVDEEQKSHCDCRESVSCQESDHQVALNKGHVCGSNNITYPSECQMRMDSCQKGAQIYVKYSGSCGEYLFSSHKKKNFFLPKIGFQDFFFGIFFHTK